MSIIIPRRMNEQPKYACTICPKVFYEDERHQYERHVISHPREDLAAHSPAMQAPALFGHEGGDQEWRAFIERKKVEDPHGWQKWMKTSDGKHSSGLGDG